MIKLDRVLDVAGLTQKVVGGVDIRLHRLFLFGREIPHRVDICFCLFALLIIGCFAHLFGLSFPRRHVVVDRSVEFRHLLRRKHILDFIGYVLVVAAYEVFLGYVRRGIQSTVQLLFGHIRPDDLSCIFECASARSQTVETVLQCLFFTGQALFFLFVGIFMPFELSVKILIGIDVRHLRAQTAKGVDCEVFLDLFGRVSIYLLSLLGRQHADHLVEEYLRFQNVGCLDLLHVAHILHIGLVGVFSSRLLKRLGDETIHDRRKITFAERLAFADELDLLWIV